MAGTNKGRSTRHRILDTAWALSDQQGVEGILGGVTLREIAAAAGMTPSGITYHFPTLRELSVAMVQRLADSLSPMAHESLDALPVQTADESVDSLIGRAAHADWELLTTPQAINFERRLSRCIAMAGTEPDCNVTRDSIGSLIDGWIGDLAAIVERVAGELGLEPAEPLTFDEVARAAWSLTGGLLKQWMCSPESVRTDLQADLIVALIGALLVPAPRTVALAERAAALRGWAIPLRASEDDLSLAALAAPLFAHAVDGVSLTEAARKMGLDPGEAVDRFGSIHTVAALSFGRHVPSIADAVERRRTAGASISLTDGIYELARCAIGDPYCALALAHERHRAAAGPAQTLDVCDLVPLTSLIAEPLAAATSVPAGEVRHLGDLMVDTVLVQAATHPRAQITAITEIALRLLPPIT